jgi:hypothetical protein
MRRGKESERGGWGTRGRGEIMMVVVIEEEEEDEEQGQEQASRGIQRGEKKCWSAGGAKGM